MELAAARLGARAPPGDGRSAGCARRPRLSGKSPSSPQRIRCSSMNASIAAVVGGPISIVSVADDLRATELAPDLVARLLVERRQVLVPVARRRGDDRADVLLLARHAPAGLGVRQRGLQAPAGPGRRRAGGAGRRRPRAGCRARVGRLGQGMRAARRRRRAGRPGRPGSWRSRRGSSRRRRRPWHRGDTACPVAVVAVASDGAALDVVRLDLVAMHERHDRREPAPSRCALVRSRRARTPGTARGPCRRTRPTTRDGRSSARTAWARRARQQPVPGGARDVGERDRARFEGGV